MRALHVCSFAAAMLMAVGHASATEPLDTRPSWYLQTGKGENSTYAVVAGITLPWKSVNWSLGGSTVRAHWDLWLGGGSNRDLQHNRFDTPAFGAGPSLRWRGAQGTSPWFFEAGTGVMLTGKHLYNGNQRMGSRWNFASHLGVGMNFGPQHAHELSLRLQHASNAGIKDPNPGINLLQIRYAHQF